MTREEARFGWITQQFDVNLPDGTPMKLVMEAPPGTEVSCTLNGKIDFKWPYPPAKEAGPIQVNIVPCNKQYQN